MTWKQLTERDRREWKLSAIDPHDRDTWRSGVIFAMPIAWKGAHCYGYGPCTCTLIKNLMMLALSPHNLTQLHSERPKLYGVLVILSAVGLKEQNRLSALDLLRWHPNTSGHQFLTKLHQMDQQL